MNPGPLSLPSRCDERYVGTPAALRLTCSRDESYSTFRNRSSSGIRTSHVLLLPVLEIAVRRFNKLPDSVHQAIRLHPDAVAGLCGFFLPNKDFVLVGLVGY